MHSVTEVTRLVNPLDSDLAWYYATFIPDASRGYALMNPPGHENKYTRRAEPLTLELVRGALNGETRRTRAGNEWQTVTCSYGVTPQTNDQAPLARNIAWDIDTGGQMTILRMLTVCANYGLSAFGQRGISAIHDGGYVYALGAELLPASMLHELGQRIAYAAQVEAEVYPDNRDLRLPLMTHLRAPGGPRRFPLIFQDGEVVEARDPWAALATLRANARMTTTEQLTKLLEQLPFLPEGGGGAATQASQRREWANHLQRDRLVQR